MARTPVEGDRIIVKYRMDDDRQPFKWFEGRIIRYVSGSVYNIYFNDQETENVRLPNKNCGVTWHFKDNVPNELVYIELGVIEKDMKEILDEKFAHLQQQLDTVMDEQKKIISLLKPIKTESSS